MSYLLPYLVLLLLRDGVAVFAHEVELQGLHLPADVALSHVSTQLLYSVGLVALLIRHWANSRTLPDQQKAELLLLHHLNLLRNEYNLQWDVQVTFNQRIKKMADYCKTHKRKERELNRKQH
mgnify:CR=1 FL=1